MRANRMEKRKKSRLRDFLRSPAGKTSPSNTSSVGSIPCRGTKIPHALQPKKKKNRSNIITNSIKTFKMVFNKEL